MAEIPPIEDGYIDGIIKANQVGTPDPDRTSGAGLRELVKKLRDRLEQEIAELKAAPAPDLQSVTETGASTDVAVTVNNSITADSYIITDPLTEVSGTQDLVVRKGDGGLGRISTDEFAKTSVLESYQPLSEKGQANGYAGLDSGGKMSIAQLPDDLLGNLKYGGTYNGTVISASDAFPELNGEDLPETGYSGVYFITTTAFTRASVNYAIGDWVVHNGGNNYVKVDNTDSVSSVFGRTGNILANEADYETYYPKLSSVYTDPAWIDELAWSKVTGRPTTLSGYGITDAASDAELANYVPYTGATADVDLGSNKLYAHWGLFTQRVRVGSLAGAYSHIDEGVAFFTGGSGIGTVINYGAIESNTLQLSKASNESVIINASLLTGGAGQRVLQVPNYTGTRIIATTADIPTATNFWTTNTNQTLLSGSKSGSYSLYTNNVSDAYVIHAVGGNNVVIQGEATTGIGVAGYAGGGIGGYFVSSGDHAGYFENNNTNPTVEVVNLSSGTILSLKNSGGVVASIGNSGQITGSSHVTTGGTSSQVVLGDGTLGSYFIGAGYLPLSAGSGESLTGTLDVTQNASSTILPSSGIRVRNTTAGSSSHSPPIEMFAMYTGSVAQGYRIYNRTTAGVPELFLQSTINGGTWLNRITLTSNTIAIYNDSQFAANISTVNLTADRTYALPNTSGTIALTSDIPAGGGYWTRVGTTLSPATANDRIQYSSNSASIALQISTTNSGSGAISGLGINGFGIQGQVSGTGIAGAFTSNTITNPTVQIQNQHASGIALAILGASSSQVITGKTDGTLTAVTLVKSGGTSSQFLKADGSVDNSSYLTSADLTDVVHISGIETVTGSKTFTANNTYFYGNSSATINLGRFSTVDSDRITFGTGANPDWIIGQKANSTDLTFMNSTAAADSITISKSTNAVTLIGALTGTSATFSGDVTLSTAGKGLKIKEGSNATMGVADLVSGTVIVNTTKVTANSRIFLSVQSHNATTPGVLSTFRTAGTSFQITSTLAGDSSTVAWMIVEPA